MGMKQANRHSDTIAAILRASCIGLVGISLAAQSIKAFGQGAATAPNPTATAPKEASDGLSSLDSLSIRYRMTEKYALSTNSAAPEVLTQYQVATRETLKMMRDQAQGAPARSENVFQVIYTERPAKINPATGVTDTVRRYDAFRMKPAGESERLKIPLLEKLTVWYHGILGQPLQIFSLTEGRSIREWEYNAISTQAFIPQVISTIPTTAKRVGDSWKIPRNSAKALLGVMPQAEEYDLNGTLKEVRKGNPNKAIIAVSGTIMLDYEPAAVNARLVFSFEPKPSSGDVPSGAPAGSDAAKANRDKGTIEARGNIEKIQLALARTSPLPEGDGRLKQTVTREVLVERRPSPADAEPLTVPTVEPTTNAPNSWLTYDDPAGRFYFRHPQNLEVPPTGPMSPDEIILVDERPAGPDVIGINIQPPVTDPAKDRLSLDPEYHLRKLEQKWQKSKEEVLLGRRGWLPDADWAPLKRKVYRIEAALKPKEDSKSQRIYLDYYLVVFERNQSIVLTAMTTQDPHLEFRNQAEEIIKTYDFGTSDGSPPPISPQPRTARPAQDDAPPPRSERRTAPASPGRLNRPPVPTRPSSPRPAPDDDSEPSPFPK